MAKTGQEEAKNYPCDTCNQNFASNAVLGTHIKRVHETLVRAVPCPVCGVKLTKKKGVAQHMNPVQMYILWMNNEMEYLGILWWADW